MNWAITDFRYSQRQIRPSEKDPLRTSPQTPLKSVQASLFRKQYRYALPSNAKAIRPTRLANAPQGPRTSRILTGYNDGTSKIWPLKSIEPELQQELTS